MSAAPTDYIPLRFLTFAYKSECLCILTGLYLERLLRKIQSPRSGSIIPNSSFLIPHYSISPYNAQVLPETIFTFMRFPISTVSP